MSMDRDAEIIQRTRFNDKFFCSEYALLLLYEYFHNKQLREDIDKVARGEVKALYHGEEINGFQGFSFCLSPLMAVIGDDLYRITESLTADDDEEEQ